jgi:hypothetical protein
MTLTIRTGPFGNQSAGTFNFDTGMLQQYTLYFEDSPRRVRVIRLTPPRRSPATWRSIGV